jgi:hypothetical protein
LLQATRRFLGRAFASHSAGPELNGHIDHVAVWRVVKGSSFILPSTLQEYVKTCEPGQELPEKNRRKSKIFLDLGGGADITFCILSRTRLPVSHNVELRKGL